MWKAVFSNDVSQSLRVILACAWKLCGSNVINTSVITADCRHTHTHKYSLHENMIPGLNVSMFYIILQYVFANTNYAFLSVLKILIFAAL